MSAIEELRKHGRELSEATGIPVEVVEDGGSQKLFVLLSKAPLPSGAFRVDQTDVLFIADRLYPLSAMDMFWTEVEVVRPDGSVPQSAEAIENYVGRPWRRFSWHRNGIWKPAGNPLLDHFAFMEARLAKEVKP
jgi:hypothetical protein